MDPQSQVPTNVSVQEPAVPGTPGEQKMTPQTEQTTAPPPVLVETPKPRSKLPWVLLILILILLTAAGGVYLGRDFFAPKPEPTPQAIPVSTATLTPTSDLTSNWKTYSSSTYQVKYPEDFTIETQEASVLVLSKWGPTQKEGTELYDGISLRFQPIELPNVELESYVDTKIKEIDENVSELVSGPTPITVGPYQSLTFTTKGLGTWRNIYLQSPDKIMIIEIIDFTSDPGKLGFGDTVDQILSTFKFLD